MSVSFLFLTAQGRVRSGWRALLFTVIVVVLTGLALTAVAPFQAGGDGDPSVLDQLWMWLAVVAALFAAHALMVRFIDRAASWRYAGLDRPALRRSVGSATALGAVAILVPCAALFLLRWLRVEDAADAGVVRDTLLVLAMLAVAALAEELIFRGYLLSALADGVGWLTAIVITSAVFALLHLGNPGADVGSLAVVALAGVFLGVVRLTADSLYAAWGAHLAWNLVLAVLLHVAVSGSETFVGGWRTVETGPDWATGGAWGPEGGSFAAAGLLTATWYLARRDRWRRLRRTYAVTDTIRPATGEELTA